MVWQWGAGHAALMLAPSAERTAQLFMEESRDALIVSLI